jgi:nucleoside-diphosphate-sugar epimerase
MTQFSELTNSKIGIVGMGYVGKNLYKLLAGLRDELNIKLYMFDRNNMQQLKDETFDYIFNCAGNTGDFRQQIWETINSNIGVTEYIIKNASIIKSLVLLSSVRIYGFTIDQNHTFLETDILNNDKDHLNIDFIYNGTKMLTECVVLNIANGLPYKIIVCRLSNLYGNYSINDLDDSTYLKVMLRHKVENKLLQVNQNIFDSKGYIFISDAVTGIILCGIKSAASTIYNICSGKSYSVYDWIKFLDLKYLADNKEVASRHSSVSIEKAKKELGYQPVYSLQNLTVNQIIQA